MVGPPIPGIGAGHVYSRYLPIMQRAFGDLGRRFRRLSVRLLKLPDPAVQIRFHAIRPEARRQNSTRRTRRPSATV